MNSPKPKSIMVNIITGALVLGVIALGYVTFMQGDATAPTETIADSSGSLLLPDSSTNTLATSLRVAQTAKDLKELSNSVEDSSILFNNKAFQGLIDFSVSIPSEPAGRENPFIKTSWRLKFDELEKTAEKKASQQSSVTSMTSPAPAPVVTSTPTPTVTPPPTPVAPPAPSSSVPTFSDPGSDQDPQGIQT